MSSDYPGPLDENEHRTYSSAYIQERLAQSDYDRRAKREHEAYMAALHPVPEPPSRVVTPPMHQAACNAHDATGGNVEAIVQAALDADHSAPIVEGHARTLLETDLFHKRHRLDLHRRDDTTPDPDLLRDIASLQAALRRPEPLPEG